MGSQLQHAAKSASNQQFLDEISLLPFPDWIATVAFYRAVHLVEMLFAARGEHGTSHTHRNMKLRQQYASIYDDYHPLFNHAMVARYDCDLFQKAKLAECFRRLAAVETKVAAAIAALHD